ncbi:hypothetical protein BXZ70DRAFT_943375 [Cristinia sonorae]|uniref:F-box domain-containing protein n=1 Tax=Cristinia sonorae TaxID=1940300 RepID=A0A8K0UMA1_9AGAR|nr:hypothetical protein BXZ70DRAFT_943375 [Cristinia sonorae]
MADTNMQPEQSRESRSPLDTWNDPGLLATYLRKTKEPSGDRGVDPQSIRARAAYLRRRIEDLERVRSQLEPARLGLVDTELASARFKHKIALWLMFPINQLPPEILALIFHFVLNSSDGPHQAVWHRLVITWVCRYWRDVAINDKLFWNIIWFRDRPPYTRSLAWVDRAGSALLEIRIDEMKRRAGETEDPPKLTREQVNAVMDALLAKVSTLRTLVMVVHTRPAALAVLEKFRAAGQPVSLERFEIHRSGPPNESPSVVTPATHPDEGREHIVLFNGDAPRLKWLVINGVGIDWRQSPIANLTTIDLRRLSSPCCPPLDRWLDILQACPSLYRLALDAAGPKLQPDSDAISRPPVDLLNLRDLFIGDASVLYAKYIFTYMTTPALTCLTLLNLWNDDFGPLFDLLVGRFPNLRILALYHIQVARIDIHLNSLARFFDSIPRLQYLKLSRAAQLIGESLLENPREHRRGRIHYTDTKREVLCPELRWMTVHFQEVALVKTVLRRRRELGAPFQKVYYLPANPQYTKEAMEELATFLEDGVHRIPDNFAQTNEEKVVHREMLKAGKLDIVPLYDDVW